MCLPSRVFFNKFLSSPLAPTTNSLSVWIQSIARNEAFMAELGLGKNQPTSQAPATAPEESGSRAGGECDDEDLSEYERLRESRIARKCFRSLDCSPSYLLGL